MATLFCFEAEEKLNKDTVVLRHVLVSASTSEEGRELALKRLCNLCIIDLRHVRLEDVVLRYDNAVVLTYDTGGN